MRVVHWLLIAMLLAIPVQAYEVSEYSVEYNLVSGKAIVDLSISLNEKTSGFEWSLPADSTAIEVKGFDFEKIALGTSNKIRIKGSQLDKVNIKYITGSVLEKTKDRFFILDFSAAGPAKKSITVNLPEKASLKYALGSQQPSIMPSTEKVYTDGKRIIIKWDDNDLKNSSTILVIYNELSDGNMIFWISAISVIALSSVALFFYYGKNIKKNSIPKKGNPKRSEFTRNLFEDEKKIIEVLLNSKEKEMWQKQLQSKSGLSKVKLSRKLRTLEQKGLIEKIPYGNTNKIRIKEMAESRD